jgi:GMP synthase (glutamine-hydrolysing)
LLKDIARRVIKIQCLQHIRTPVVDFFSNWAGSRGHSLACTNTKRDAKLPLVEDFDGLIVLGGPQSACHLDDHPYLYAAVDLIEQTLIKKKPVLGICLGAQLIGHAMGAPATRNPFEEVGCYPITLTPAGSDARIFSSFQKTFPAFHWHRDQIGLPVGSVVLGVSEACSAQIVRFSDQALGLQCHLEFTRNTIQRMIQALSPAWPKGPFIQSQEALLASPFDVINEQCLVVLDHCFQRAVP